MRDQLNTEDNMQMFLGSNGNSPKTGTLLPYHFNDECHLVLNDNFYTPSPLYGTDKLLDPFEDEEMEFDLGSSFEKMKEEVKTEAVKVESCETGSEVSTVASGPYVTPIAIPMESIHTLDEQLDFIMETTKKHQKPREKSHRRNRKTPDQLKILIDDLGDVQNADKLQIKEVAEKTGLTELQVYKWYWDRKSKN